MINEGISFFLFATGHLFQGGNKQTKTLKRSGIPLVSQKPNGVINVWVACFHCINFWLDQSELTNYIITLCWHRQQRAITSLQGKGKDSANVIRKVSEGWPPFPQPSQPQPASIPDQAFFRSIYWSSFLNNFDLVFFCFLLQLIMQKELLGCIDKCG